MEREIVLEATPAEVWAALVESDRLSAWFGARVELDARPGGRATFSWADGRTRLAVVEAVEEGRYLLLRWLPFVREGNRTRPLAATRVTFLVQATERGTRLRVIETGGASMSEMAVT